MFQSLNTACSITLDLKLSVLAERFAVKAGADSVSTLQRTYVERWLTNCLTCTKTWLVCSDGFARFCRSMLACGMVAEVDPVLRNELNMVLMVVAPPSLSLDVQEANKVDQVFELLSSAVGAGDSLCR